MSLDNPGAIAEADPHRVAEILAAFPAQCREALTLRCFGEAHLARARFAQATVCLEEALRIWRELQVPLGEARTLVVRGDVHAATGDCDAARAAWAAWNRALRLFEGLDLPEGRALAQRLQATGSSPSEPRSRLKRI